MHSSRLSSKLGKAESIHLQIIGKHSEFIQFPIELQVEKTEEKDVTDEDDKDKENEEKKDESGLKEIELKRSKLDFSKESDRYYVR